MKFTHQWLRILLLFVAAQTSSAEEPSNVLFIGNSYTQGIRGTITKLYQQSDQKNAKLSFVTPGGKTLAYHLASEKNRALIDSGEFDFVVLQDQSQTPAVFPDKFQQAAKGLNELIQEKKGKVVFYQTWGRRDGDPRNRYEDFTAMQKALTKSYAKAGKTLDAKVAPVGEAFKIIHKSHPDLFDKLYRKDGSHPSKYGAYLAAITIYSTINNVNPKTIHWDGGLSAEEATTLRQAAATAILDQ